MRPQVAKRIILFIGLILDRIGGSSSFLFSPRWGESSPEGAGWDLKVRLQNTCYFIVSMLQI
jgi:hypothetical protein